MDDKETKRVRMVMKKNLRLRSSLTVVMTTKQSYLLLFSDPSLLFLPKWAKKKNFVMMIMMMMMKEVVNPAQETKTKKGSQS